MTASLFDLTGHAALVTGGNSGIGLGMAHGLAQSGADVCIWGTNVERNEAAVQELEKHGTRVRAIRCDVGDEAQVQAAFAGTVEHFGRVDSCFANAGVGGSGTRFVATSLEDFRAVTRVNLDGAFLTLRAAAAHMVERGGGGVLVGTSSVSAVHGAPRGRRTRGDLLLDRSHHPLAVALPAHLVTLVESHAARIPGRNRTKPQA